MCLFPQSLVQSPIFPPLFFPSHLPAPNVLFSFNSIFNTLFVELDIQKYRFCLQCLSLIYMNQKYIVHTIQLLITFFETPECLFSSFYHCFCLCMCYMFVFTWVYAQGHQGTHACNHMCFRNELSLKLDLAGWERGWLVN